MNLFKKCTCIALCGFLIASLTGCGKKTQTAVLTYEDNKVSIEYQLEAREDIIETITQISTIAHSPELEASASSYQSVYGNIEGVTYTTEFIDNNFVETIIIDATNEAALQSLTDQGLLATDGISSSISFQKTVDNLTSQGWTIQE